MICLFWAVFSGRAPKNETKNETKNEAKNETKDEKLAQSESNINQINEKPEDKKDRGEKSQDGSVKTARKKGAVAEFLITLLITLALFLVVYSIFLLDIPGSMGDYLLNYVLYGVMYFTPTFFAYYNKTKTCGWLFVVNALAG